MYSSSTRNFTVGSPLAEAHPRPESPTPHPRDSRSHRWLLSIFCLLLPVASGGALAQDAVTYLSLGYFEQGTYSGTEPFAVTSDCTQSGDDCSDEDRRIRSNDIMQFAWSVAASGLPTETPVLPRVILEQTLLPAAGAVVDFAGIPAACLHDSQAATSSAAESRIERHDNGSSTLYCELGPLSNGEQRSFSVAVKPSTASRDRARFRSAQRVYALALDGTPLGESAVLTDDRAFLVSAAPAFDLIGNRSSLSRGPVAEIDLGNGLERGFVFQYTAHVATATERGTLGIEPLATSFSFSPGIRATLEDGVTPYQPNYVILDCQPNRYDWPDAVYGLADYNPTVSPERKVTDSGECRVEGDAQQGYRLIINDADTGNTNYPSATLSGQSLAAGPYFVASYTIDLFIPFATLDAADGELGNARGHILLGACLSDFDPVSTTGVSNYLDAVEPGFNGTAMPDGTRSNNCTEWSSAQLSTDGEFSFRALSVENDEGTTTQYAPYISAFHAGDGVVEPNQSFGTMLYYRNNGSESLTGFETCTVFDNSVLRLTDRGDIGASPGTYAYLGSRSGADFDPTQWQLEYGVAPVIGDDPLDGDLDGATDFDPVTGRYLGRWTRLSRLRCSSPSIEWHSDAPVDRIDDVNVIRFRAIDSSTALEPGQELRLITPLSPRASFHHGAYAGQSIPNGTVAAAFGSFRSNEREPDWYINQYRPAPENGSVDGDRMTISRATINTALTTAVPVAAPGEVSTVLAGDPVRWQLVPVISSNGFDGEIIEDLTVELTLSAGSTYAAGCTLASPGTLPPTNLRSDHPASGQTTISWQLGTVAANVTLPPLSVCVDTDPFLPTGTTVSATARAFADNAVTSPPRTQVVSLGQAGAMQSDVILQESLATPGGEQQYLLRWLNFSTTSPFKKPIMINVLPFNGDGTGDAPRSPASAFGGSIALTGVPQLSFTGSGDTAVSDTPSGALRFTADPPQGIDRDPAQNHSNWCTWQNGRFVGTTRQTVCPKEWRDVTAIRFDAEEDLDVLGSGREGMTLAYYLSTSDNRPGDVYTNGFSIDSESLPGEQYLIARSASVSIVSYAISGQVFAAIDGDTDFDAGVDATVPDGITIELLSAASETVLDKTVTRGGQYQFSGLLPGDYIVRLPRSTFDELGVLPGWSVAKDRRNQNPTLDLSYPDSSTSGIRSQVIALSSASGAENPVAEALVDFALAPGDADQDGIPDVDEFGDKGLSSGGVDTDGDGIPDYIDTDSDGDGIPDSAEHNTDSDGDGIADYIDTDSDADGVPDSAEGVDDQDGDGIPDYIDSVDNTDSDGDTLPDSVEGTVDTDGDGLDNSHDTDSDNDTIGDQIEKNTDTDGDGLPNYIDVDSDGDGIDDQTEGTQDRNGNGIPDYIDNEVATDSDGDGIADFIEGNADVDGDSLPNSEDLDSDGDGIPDQVETVADSDGDGVANYIDIDSDNDGIADLHEGAVDTDADGIPDYLDLDSDNDSVADVVDAGGNDRDGNGRLDNVIDANHNGIHDAIESAGLFIIDTDHDGVPNAVDIDSDNDGLTDLLEMSGGIGDADFNGQIDAPVDEDRDGRDDLNGQSPFVIDIDIDQDGTVNSLDLDSDGDGRSDLRESGQADRNGDFIVDPMTDVDQDAIQDINDADYQSGLDADADGINDRADIDFVAGPDTDGDGMVDWLDPDADGNGYVDKSEDEAALDSYPDIDGNGVPDFRQPISNIVRTGVGGEGIGCQIGHGEARDPTLLILALTALLCLWHRARRQLS